MGSRGDYCYTLYLYLHCTCCALRTRELHWAMWIFMHSYWVKVIRLQ